MEYWKQELYHHGILGMRWGKRNGPPYPLDASDHSASERKAGWRKSLGGGRNPQDYAHKKGLSDKQKRALKIAGMAVVGGAVIYGAYKYSQLKSNARPTIELGMKFVSSFNEKPQVHTVESIKINPLKKEKGLSVKELKELGIKTFEPETFEYDTFKPETFEYDTFKPETFEFDTFKPETFFDDIDQTQINRGRSYAEELLNSNLETLRKMGF